MKPDLSKGQLIKWNDERGFGFIKPSKGGKEVFLHISAVKTTGRRPKVGDTIFYGLTTGADGKIRASNASIQGVVSQSLIATRTTRASAKPKKRNILVTIMSIGIVTMIGLLLLETQPSRSPHLITAVTKPGCLIKGNVSIGTGEKIYHLPGMEDYESTVINPKYGEKWFCTESEAVQAGWRKATR